MSAKQFEVTVGRGELDNDLRHARRANAVNNANDQTNPMITRENDEQLDEGAFIP